MLWSDNNLKEVKGIFKPQSRDTIAFVIRNLSAQRYFDIGALIVKFHLAAVAGRYLRTTPRTQKGGLDTGSVVFAFSKIG
jgi:hypothetical protein